MEKSLKKTVFLKQIISKYEVILIKNEDISSYIDRLYSNEHLIIVTPELIYISQPSSPSRIIHIHHQNSTENNVTKWNYSMNNGEITIDLSIKTDGGYYREHYYIKNSKIVWLNDSFIEEDLINYHLKKEC
jgi:hypothetical protein